MEADELFSSWLIRSSLANGCDPLAFADAIWPKWRVWTIDIDREIPQEKLESLAKSCRVPIQELDGSTLWVTASRVSNKVLPKKNFWDWILTVGARNRRRSGGLQYCPACLTDDESPYFRKYWRYAWHTVCEKHGVILLDRCHGCRGAIQPHRLSAEMKNVTNCPVCKSDLRSGETLLGVEHALIFQQTSDSILSGEEHTVHDKKVSATEWFAIARLYWDLVRRIIENRTESLTTFGRSIGLQDLHLKPGMFSIEQARTRDRHTMLGGVYRIMNLPSIEIKKLLEVAAVTFQAFCPSRAQLPSTLGEIACGLKSSPVTRSRKPKVVKNDVRAPKSRKSVERMMRQLMDKAVI